MAFMNNNHGRRQSPLVLFLVGLLCIAGCGWLSFLFYICIPYFMR